MGMLSKKYLRYLSYVVGLVLLRFVIVKLYYGEKTLDKDLLQYDRSEWLSANDLEERHLNRQVVVNIGKLKCFHLGTVWKHCYIKSEILPSPTRFAERVVIEKDLKGSEGFNWAGFSEYLYYDALAMSSVAAMEEEELDKVNMVTWITDVDMSGTKKYEHLHVSIQPFSLYEVKNGAQVFSELNVLFGEDSVDPRPGWHLEKSWPLSKGSTSAYLTYKFLDLEETRIMNEALRLGEEGRFKILQLADLHFSAGKSECRDEFPKHPTCEADSKTLRFIERVLDIESPDLVVYTGDQIMGDRSIRDSETSLLKAVAPAIRRKIPWAMVWGNHDDEGSLGRWALSKYVESLPYSIFQISPKDTKDNSFGVGNYFHQIIDPTTGKPAATLYFLDSHKYSTTGKVYPGYDWIKEAQWDYLRELYDEKISPSLAKPSQKHLSMAFFHIPLPEYLDFDSQKEANNRNPLVGNSKEAVMAPKYNSNAKKTLDHLGVSVTSCGHDHCNDYCLLDDSTSKKTWLCYGGGTGEGGYGGYGGTERRVRIYLLDGKNGDIHTWKRLNGNPNGYFDYQLMVSGGAPNAG